MDFSTASVEQLIDKDGYDCACGRHHKIDMEYIKIGKGATQYLPQALCTLGVQKPFIVADKNTYKAAGDCVLNILKENNIAYTLYVFEQDHIEPDEHALGTLVMHFDPSCDCVMGIGSGVINDCCRVLSYSMNKKQIIVGTAPSMDGYASNSSSMIMDRIKVSLYARCPAAIILDIDIIKNAPLHMIHAGFGDMLAKYIAICEWRISHLVTGEYYCDNIASLMRASVKKIVQNAPRLNDRDEKAIEATVEGLVLSGIAMSYAQISRPASGLEHYFSHLFEMMALDRNTPYELHGIQVGVGTLLTLKLYDEIKKMSPDKQTEENFIQSFNDDDWQKMIKRIFGKAADTVIQQEHTIFHKNDKDAHKVRFENILHGWQEILRFIDEELPQTQDIEKLMASLHMPMTVQDIGVSRQDAEDAFIASRDIRDKYLSSSMLWDMGVLYTMQLPE